MLESQNALGAKRPPRVGADPVQLRRLPLPQPRFGLFGLRGVQAIGHDIVLAPWRTPPGLALLFVAFFAHLTLGFRGLYRRRHLCMPAIEAWQFALGFTIPLLLAPHVTDARLGVLLFGLEEFLFSRALRVLGRRSAG